MSKRRNATRVARPPAPPAPKSTPELDATNHAAWQDAAKEMGAGDSPSPASDTHAWQDSAFTGT